MNKLILLTAVLFTSSFFTSCDKNDSPPKSNTDYIIQGAWKFEKAMSMGTDVSGFLNACYKDNVMTFVANGSGPLMKARQSAIVVIRKQQILPGTLLTMELR